MLNATKWLFIAEINNEKHGGDSPATLQSALESIQSGYNPDPDSIIFMSVIENEVMCLITCCGENKEVADFISKYDYESHANGTLQERARNEQEYEYC